MKAHYIRVSTIGQNTDRQVEQVEAGWEKFLDKSSGSIPFAERSGGARIMKYAEDKKLSELKVHSIDRLGRNTVDVLSTIQTLTALGVNVISHKEGLQTLIDGKENPTAKLVIGILATVSELERSLILERQREGIAVAKKRGAYKGRPSGTHEDEKKFLAKHKKVQKAINQGLSLRDASSVAGVSVNTVRKVKSLM